MSTKTYAGFRNVREYGVQHSLSGRDGYVICPIDNDDDHRYRSRLGYPWSNSGPWMTVERVIDEETPSTDGAFDVSIGQASGVAIEIWIADYKFGCNARFTYSTRPRTLRLQYSENVLYSARRTSSRSVVLDEHYYAVLTESLAEGEWPFSISDLSNIYATRDYSRAVDVARMAGRLARSMPLNRVYNDEDRTVSRNVGAWLNLDLTPPEQVYLGVRNDAELYLLTGILPGHWAMGWETAYIEACKSMPEAATNMAANILEAASLLASIFSGDILGEIPKTARDAWLSYRYVYTTTKLDVREVRSVFDRLSSLSTKQLIAVYGSYARGGIEYRVGFDIDIAQVVPRDVSTTLQTFGLRLNALNVWDMIPYSFVVDWFLPISDIIEYFQDLSACEYEPQDLWFSMTTVIDGYRVHVRLPGRKLSTMPYLQLSSAGTKTICLRIADAVALFMP